MSLSRRELAAHALIHAAIVGLEVGGFLLYRWWKTKNQGPIRAIYREEEVPLIH